MQKRHIVMAVCLALAISLLLSLGGVVTFAEECNGIRDEVLRLHVLANSNSEADQALKLKVRDTILKEAEGLLDTATNKEEAVQQVKASLPMLIQAAQARVEAEGYTYSVKAELCEMYFTTRVYETGTLPAGNYTALRITIGEGAGNNWWCVVYPSMCLSSAGQKQQWSDVLNQQQTNIIEHPERYQIRFKVVEWVRTIGEYLSHWW